MDRIEYVAGIPRWFTRMHHWYAKTRYCRRRGHVRTLWRSCNICGEFL